MGANGTSLVLLVTASTNASGARWKDQIVSDCGLVTWNQYGVSRLGLQIQCNDAEPDRTSNR
jgi:hypothetical protein